MRPETTISHRRFILKLSEQLAEQIVEICKPSIAHYITTCFASIVDPPVGGVPTESVVHSLADSVEDTHINFVRLGKDGSEVSAKGYLQLYVNWAVRS